jgi:hypothetical protein
LERLLRAAKPLSRSQRNDGYGADIDNSRGHPCRPALRPERTSVETPPEHLGDDSKPSRELAAVRKYRPFADGTANW